LFIINRSTFAAKQKTRILDKKGLFLFKVNPYALDLELLFHKKITWSPHTNQASAAPAIFQTFF
jgi:hypothetical protein